MLAQSQWSLLNHVVVVGTNMLVLHVHDRWSALGGADWHLLSVLDSLPEWVRPAGLFGRADGSVDGSGLAGLSRVELHFLKKLDQRAPFENQGRVGARLLELVQNLGPDLIHVHNILNPHLLKVLAESGPAVMTVQDHRFFCPGRGKVREDGRLCRETFGRSCAGCFRDREYFERLLDLVESRLSSVARFKALTVLSHYMGQELIQAGLDGDRIQVIPPFCHGLEQQAGPAAEGRSILFVGRLVWAKGLFDLLQALALVPGDGKLVVVGSGTMDEQVAARVRELNLTDRVEFTGWRSHQELAAVYGQARLVVLPSRWQEPFGIVGLEAQALGRPVVAYDVGGVREWLDHGVTGLMTSPGDIPALAAAMTRLLEEPALATALGEAGRRVAQARFDRQSLMARLTDLYQAVVG
jgi:glycosyltransferase involved in cell wall biosynthesis